MAKVQLTDVSLFLPRLPVFLEGRRVLHVADLHSRGFRATEKVLRSVLAEGADLLLISGDSCFQMRLGNPFGDTSSQNDCHKTGWTRRGYVFPPSDNEALAVWRELLAACRFPLGVFAVQGNHDTARFMAGLPALGVTVLTNESRLIDAPAGRLGVGGLRGYGRQTADIPAALAGVEAGVFTIALSHYPEAAAALAAAGVDLIVAGHTHGGQVCLPGGRLLATHCWLEARYAAGLVRLGDSVLYTSRGLGTSMIPIRLFCPPEIVRFTLHRGDAGLTRLAHLWLT
jgi:uncharacterized protein